MIRFGQNYSIIKSSCSNNHLCRICVETYPEFLNYSIKECTIVNLKTYYTNEKVNVPDEVAN